MIKQEFYVEDYWKVIIYYNVDFHLLSVIGKEMGIYSLFSKEVFNDLKSGMVKAVTCSNLAEHVSIILFNKHSSRTDYINSIAHEAEHVKQAMLKAYDVEDKGEAPAYTLGYLMGKMYRTFKKLICPL